MSGEKIVSFTEKDKSLTPDDIAKLEAVLGYKLEVPESFWEEPDTRFIYFLYDVLVEARKAICLDWEWDGEGLFHQLAAIYPQLKLKLVSDEVKEEDDRKIVDIRYEVEGETMEEVADVDKVTANLIGKLNGTLIEKTGTQLVEYLSGSDEQLWFVAPTDFSEDEFNAVTSDD